MREAVGVELECSRCMAETVHQATIEDGRLVAFQCVACGTTTRVAAPTSGLTAAPKPLGAFFVGPLQLGQGERALEGSIALSPGTVLHQGLEAVRLAHALREMDCRVLRLQVATADQLSLVAAIKASTGLPLLVDIGSELSLAAQAVRSQADGLIFTCEEPKAAETIGLAVSPAFNGVVVVRTTGDDLYKQIQTAEGACRVLCRWNHPNLAVTPQVSDPGRFTLVVQALHERLFVPVRAQLPMPGGSVDPVISTATALGTALTAGGVGLVSMPGLTARTQPMYNTAGEVLRQLQLRPDQDILGVLVYMAGKAFERMISKPGRMLHEMEKAPEIFARSMPLRVISKPQRVVGEIRRLLRKTS